MHSITIGSRFGNERLTDLKGSQSDNGVASAAGRLCSVITGRLEHLSFCIAIWNRGQGYNRGWRTNRASVGCAWWYWSLSECCGPFLKIGAEPFWTDSPRRCVPDFAAE